MKVKVWKDTSANIRMRCSEDRPIGTRSAGTEKPSCGLMFPFSIREAVTFASVSRWPAPYGNSRVFSSLKRRTLSKLQICSRRPPSHCTPGIAGAVQTRALKVTSPCVPLHRAEVVIFWGVGHEDWKFDRDMETQMLGSVKPYIRQVKSLCISRTIRDLTDRGGFVL